jgi:hypothetical protein
MFRPFLGHHQALEENQDYFRYKFKTKHNSARYIILRLYKGITLNFNLFYSNLFNLGHNHTSEGACVYH